MPHASFGHMLDAVAREPKPIETAEQAIQEMGDAIAHIMNQMLKGNWVDDNGHDVKNNVYMIGATDTMRRVMEFRTRTMGYKDVSNILDGGEKRDGY